MPINDTLNKCPVRYEGMCLPLGDYCMENTQSCEYYKQIQKEYKRQKTMECASLCYDDDNGYDDFGFI